MKSIFKHISPCLVAVALVAAGCSDSMDTTPKGSHVLGSTIASDPSSVSGLVNGMYADMIEAEAITSWAGATRHYDFGYASTMLMMDNDGQDEVSRNTGYNWYRNNLRYTDRTATSEITYFLWNQMYKLIGQANSVLSYTENPATDEARGYHGQGLAMRAFAYLNLAQMYQFTYKGHETAPCVPIVTETMTAEEKANNPRATVQAVYDRILADLDSAIVDLDGATTTGKGQIGQAAAYGLRARANLIMQNWKAAAADAESAISVSNAEPLSLDEAAKPGFNDISAHNWIWGMDINETSDVVQTGILNFPSMMSSFTGNGYSPNYAPKLINSKLYNEIDTTDVRRGWWLDGNGNTPIVPAGYMYKEAGADGSVTVYCLTTENDSNTAFANWQPYINVKFCSYQNKYGNETNACDVPLMRVEEMYLIKAEAKAMSGDVEGGKKVLVDFVRAYRDPKYTCKATTAEGVQEAVWFQRRVELWGEGFSFFDLMRLKKPVDRRGANYESSVTYYIPAESQIMLYIIPEAEVNNNRGIKAEDNNPVAAIPKPVKVGDNTASSARKFNVNGLQTHAVSGVARMK